MKTTSVNYLHMKTLCTALLVAFCSLYAAGQMEINGTVLYGNEWIDYDKTYWKVQVAETGAYRLSRQELVDAGLPVETTPLSRIQMIYFGEDHPIYRSTAGIATDDDFILFFGEQHKSQLDKFVYTEDVKMFNPEYSLVSDTSAYFLTVADQDIATSLQIENGQSSTAGLQVETYYTHEETVVFDQAHYKPVINSGLIQFSTMMESEGFGTSLQPTTSFSIPTKDYVFTGPSPRLEVIIGGNRTGHTWEVSVNGNLKFVYDTPQGASNLNEAIQANVQLTAADMSDNVQVRVDATRSGTDRNRISTGKLTYPRAYRVETGQTSYGTIPAAGSRRVLDFGTTAGQVYVYSQELNTVFQSFEEADSQKIIFPASGQDLEVVFYTNVKTTGPLAEKTYIDYSTEDYDYIIISNSMLFDDGNGTNYVQDYADYRASELGGGYTPLVVDIEQLYDQYGYGIDRHFLCIRNFNFWADQTYSDVKSEFIIGKAREYNEHRKEASIMSNDNFLVPSFGLPGSDILLATNPEKVNLLFPVGRLAATTTEDVSLYLDKVRDYDQNRFNPQSIEEKLWQKRIIHLSGGKTTGEQQSIANSLLSMEEIVEGPRYGADVRTFFKTSSNAIEDIPSELILDLINGGVSAITFFGHSSPGTFDFNLDNAKNYENKGKYPVMFSLGCYAGNIHTSAKALSEQFVLERDKGAIAFIATTGSAYIPTLRIFGQKFYGLMAEGNYGGTLGENLEAVLDSLNGQTSDSYTTFLQQIALHGDPAVYTIAYDGPDMVVDNASPKTNPTFIDAFQEDFEFCFDIANLGSFVRDSFDVSIQHLSPEGIVVTDTTMRVEMPGFRQNYCVELPLGQEVNLIGQNKITVAIDSNNEIDEQPSGEAEANNRLVQASGTDGFDFFILSNSAVPTYPYEFSIINESTVTLVANTYNGLSEASTYMIEVDTTAQFDSPYKKEYTKAGVSSIIEQEISLDLPAGTVFYWRVSPMVENTEVGLVWSASSFVYEPSLGPGYSQSHYFQFLENEYDNINLKEDRRFYFATNFREVQLEQRFFQSNDVQGKFFLNGNRQNSMYRSDFTPSIGVVVIDTLGEFKRNEVGGSFGAINTYSVRIFTFYYKTNTQQSRIDLINFLENEIEDGQYVILFPILRSKSTNWMREEWESDAELTGGKTISSVLAAQGAQLFEDFKTTYEVLPYAFSYRHNVGVLDEQIASTQDDILTMKVAIPGFWFEGSMEAEMVGPALDWNTFEWNAFDENIQPRDSFNMTVHGVTATGQRVMLIDSTEERTVDLAFIDAAQYPYLSVRYYASDIWSLSPIQLDYWRVQYTPLADLGLSASIASLQDSVQAGQPLELAYQVKNNTPYDMGPTTVTYDIVSPTSELVSSTSPLEAIPAFSTKDVKLEYPTTGLEGKHQLRLEVNRPKSPMERYYFNNLGFAEFKVYPDGTDPVLNVTFDGVHILDNDIVSGEPSIRVELKDENQYLLLTDTQGFDLVLEHPDGLVTQVDKNSAAVIFTPATAGEGNEAILEYNPQLEQDGTYKLSVRARDATGNIAGNSEYSVSFRVFNEEMVSDVFNYPNPFSTSTQFVFTLTGNEDPGNILIRIMTVTGKVVKEITMAELGNIRIGVNRTDYKWDGTDEFGDRLANGVYLYQVITKKLDGSDYRNFTDPSQNNTNWMFNEGFGKMVIMR